MILARLAPASTVDDPSLRRCVPGEPHVCVDEWRSLMRARGLSADTLRLRSGAVLRAARHAGVGPCQLEGEQLIDYLDRDMAAWARAAEWSVASL